MCVPADFSFATPSLILFAVPFGKVASWYHVVVFTASVQEYADPVIDWLDQGRGLISGRLFREVSLSSSTLPDPSCPLFLEHARTHA